MIVVVCSLLLYFVCCQLFAVRCLLRAVRYAWSLFVVGVVLFVERRVLIVVVRCRLCVCCGRCSPVFAVRCLSCIACGSLIVVRCSLFVVCCLMFVVGC